MKFFIVSFFSTHHVQIPQYFFNITLYSVFPLFFIIADNIWSYFTVYGLWLEGLAYEVIATGTSCDFLALVMYIRIECLEPGL
jgi:hypothetical protein